MHAKPYSTLVTNDLSLVQGLQGPPGVDGTDGTPGTRGLPGKKVKRFFILS